MGLARAETGVAGQTLLEHCEVWARRFKPRDERNTHFLLDTWHRYAGWGIQDLFGPESCMVNGGASPKCRLQEGAYSQTVTGNKLSQLYDCAATACSSPWMDSILSGGRNSGHSLGLVQHREAGFSSGCSGRDGL